MHRRRPRYPASANDSESVKRSERECDRKFGLRMYIVFALFQKLRFQSPLHDWERVRYYYLKVNNLTCVFCFFLGVHTNHAADCIGQSLIQHYKTQHMSAQLSICIRDLNCESRSARAEHA